ncbi:hypothetical protein V3C99_018766 [Haemonchus contortus]
MRRALLAAVLIATTHAAVFTEGGALGDVVYPAEYDYPKSNALLDVSDPDEGIQEWYPRQDYSNERLSNARNSEELSELEAEILQELTQQQKEQNEKTEETAVPREVEIELQNVKEQPNETGKVTGTEKAEPQIDVVEKQPLVAQKKGQNEFVSFVEPVESKQTQSIATMEKRRLASSDFTSSLPTYGSNLLVIAVGTVLIVGMVGTVVGGGYYIKRRRSSPDDSEYAPYAGTGPGFKKNKGDKGDESLAYKAQLHQYQQAKQKIICGEDVPAGLESDGEDDGADDENNFSVYECPGLAPTGDIEVCNPNFAAHP